jgi:hypothetical protein
MKRKEVCGLEETKVTKIVEALVRDIVINIYTLKAEFCYEY